MTLNNHDNFIRMPEEKTLNQSLSQTPAAKPEAAALAGAAERQHQPPSSNAPDEGRNEAKSPAASSTAKPREIGGPKGPEPTRYGDWEKNGRCIDF